MDKQKTGRVMMKKIAVLAAVSIIVAISAWASFSSGSEPQTLPEPGGEDIILQEIIPPQEPEPEPSAEPEPEEEPDPEPEPEPEPTPEPEPEPEPEFFVIAMMGDCTFGSEHTARNNAGSFQDVVREDYAYPFSLVKPIYEDADFVIVNLESAMTHHDIPINKRFRFNARPDYVNILIKGGIHFVTLGNNHAKDYGQAGYDATEEWLAENGIGFAPYNGWSLHTTERGLVIGVYSHNFPNTSNIPRLTSTIAEMKAAGAEVVIMAFHWGIEGTYRATPAQKQIGRAVVDAGAHIVMGTHPHTIQEAEEYNGGVIYYSLANWSFGGNRNPVDKDSLIAMVTIMRDLDSSISVTGVSNIPASVSSTPSRNDFRPMPYEAGSVAYLRVLSKLDGTYTGPDLIASYDPPDEADEDEPADTPGDSPGDSPADEPGDTPAPPPDDDDPADTLPPADPPTDPPDQDD